MRVALHLLTFRRLSLIKIIKIAFKWATFYHHSLRGCKTVTFQNWRSKKNSCAGTIEPLFTKYLNTETHQIFFQPPTLIGHSFTATWAMIMKNSSFETPKSYLLALDLKQYSSIKIGQVVLKIANLLHKQLFCHFNS